MTKSKRHLTLVPEPKKAPARKSVGDKYRTLEAQEMFRQRWNAAQERLAR